MSNSRPGSGEAAWGYRYTSVELVEVAWRGRGVAVLVYRQLGPVLQSYGPGQFIHFWIPGVKAVPLAPVPVGGDWGELALIVKARGEATRRLVEEPPRRAGVIGPLGRRLRPPRGRWLHVAGGTGVAAELLLARVTGGTLVYGARSAEELAPLRELGLLPRGVELVEATEDGSRGDRGTAVDVALRLLRGGGYGYVSAAGPRGMLRALVPGAAEAVGGAGRVYVSPEAIVKCGMGFCGRCMLCSGHLLCRDGSFLRASEVACEWAS